MNRQQKRYYNYKLKGFQRMIWDLELQRYTNGVLREQTREEYDQLMSRKDALEKDKELTKDKKEELMKQVDEKISTTIQEMDLFDAMLHGKEASEQSGYIEGVNNKLDTVRSTIQKTKDFINGRG